MQRAHWPEGVDQHEFDDASGRPDVVVVVPVCVSAARVPVEFSTRMVANEEGALDIETPVQRDKVMVQTSWIFIMIVAYRPKPPPSRCTLHYAEPATDSSRAPMSVRHLC